MVTFILCNKNYSLPKTYSNKFFLESQKTIDSGKHSFGINLFDAKFVNAIKSTFKQKDQKKIIVIKRLQNDFTFIYG